MQITQITNNKEIDMTSIILKQMMGEITRDEVLQVINDNIVKTQMNMRNKTKRTKRKFSHYKIKLTEVEAIEREWAMRYNSELPKWQQEMYI